MEQMSVRRGYWSFKYTVLANADEGFSFNRPNAASGSWGGTENGERKNCQLQTEEGLQANVKGVSESDTEGKMYGRDTRTGCSHEICPTGIKDLCIPILTIWIAMSNKGGNVRAML